MLPALPKQARGLLSAIRAAGGQGYVVGGALRDLLLGQTPGDWDFATTLGTRELLRFPGARLIGGAYGTVQLPFGYTTCEVTPCRTESGYSDKRHPDEVQFVPDILADLVRRDFTINAMAYDGQMLLDPFGGRQDLENGILRCVGNPCQRFGEDALRILRLFRFAATLGFVAERETFAAAGDMAGNVAFLPRERVRSEVEKILFSKKPQALAPLIVMGGLRSYGLEFAPLLVSLAGISSMPLCRWWALFSLCGADIQKTGQAFGFSRRLLADLEECKRLYRMGPASSKLALKKKLSTTRLDYLSVGLTFASVSPIFLEEIRLYVLISNNNEPYRLQDLDIDGKALSQAGIEGEKCGRVLNELLLAVIEDPLLNNMQLLQDLAGELAGQI